MSEHRRTIQVQFAEERLSELEREVQESLGGAWYLRLSAPEVGVLVAAYRTLAAAAEAFDTGDYDVMKDALRAALPRATRTHSTGGTAATKETT